MKAQFMKYEWKLRQFIIAKGGSLGLKYSFFCFCIILVSLIVYWF